MRPEENPRARWWDDPARACALVALASVALRLYLIYRYPEIFGGDSVVRLANRDRVLLAYQLPGLQALIYAVSKLNGELAPIRFALVAVSAAASCGCYAMARRLMGAEAALAAALLFAISPFVAAFSIVPYQEILMLAGLFWAFAFFWDGRLGPASLCLGIACLTRYEAWLACPVLLWAYCGNHGWRAANVIRGGLLFGWAPLAWMAWNFGLTPAGTYAVESSVSFERLYRWAYLGWITLKNTPAPVLLLAAAGAWSFFRASLYRSLKFRTLLALTALFLVAILFSAHGERDQPERFVTAREAHLLLAGACLLAGLGALNLRRGRWAAVSLCLLWSAWDADRFVARETAEPHVRLSYLAARFLNDQASDSESALVLAKPIPAELLAKFVEAAGHERAREVLGRMHVAPPDYQRILVQSRLGHKRLSSIATPQEDGEPDWVLRWSDFEPSNPAEEALARRLEGLAPVQVLRAGDVSLAVYQLAAADPG